MVGLTIVNYGFTVRHFWPRPAPRCRRSWSELAGEPEMDLSIRNKWFTYSVGLTAGIAIVSIAVGFVWLPSEQRASSLARRLGCDLQRRRPDPGTRRSTSKRYSRVYVMTQVEMRQVCCAMRAPNRSAEARRWLCVAPCVTAPAA